MVDAGGHGVDARARVEWCGGFVGGSIGPVTGHFDAMRFGEQGAKELLGEVGVDPGVDGELASRCDHIAHSRRLDDRRAIGALQLSHFFADGEARSHHTHELAVEFVDSGAQRAQPFGHISHVANQSLRPPYQSRRGANRDAASGSDGGAPPLALPGPLGPLRWR